MRTQLSTIICLLMASSAVAQDQEKKPMCIVEGEYVIVNCDQVAAKHYGPEGRKVTIKKEGDEIVFQGIKEAAFNKTPRFKLTSGRLEFNNGVYGSCGNLIIGDVVSDRSGETIKCHGCYIGDFEL